MARAIGSGNMLIAEVVTYDHVNGPIGYPRPTHGELEANAKLIASAPEMLAALKKIAALRWGGDGDCGAVRIAEDAISIAEDGQ